MGYIDDLDLMPECLPAFFTRCLKWSAMVLPVVRGIARRVGAGVPVRGRHIGDGADRVGAQLAQCVRAAPAALPCTSFMAAKLKAENLQRSSGRPSVARAAGRPACAPPRSTAACQKRAARTAAPAPADRRAISDELRPRRQGGGEVAHAVAHPCRHLVPIRMRPVLGGDDAARQLRRLAAAAPRAGAGRTTSAPPARR